MKRLVVLDTETTGLNPAEGHRIVEIGCVELLHTRKGESFHRTVHPEREIPPEASRIHGITDEQVANAPRFAEVVDDFLTFIGDDVLVIHNAAFDVGFLNAELQRLHRRPLEMARVIDTMALARRRFPGLSASLDGLCRRLKVDNTRRTRHGALLDADLLASVYVELVGGNQLRLDLAGAERPAARPGPHPEESARSPAPTLPLRTWPLPETDQRAHAAFLDRLQRESGACVWLSLEQESP
ncbi:MAG: DNA polymerase III subunit epsilon [Magnetococcus sp. DMHC-8]